MPGEKLKILISPLNWGFGHAGRMIPVALALRQMGHTVIFGTDSALIPMIQPELPGIELICIKGANVKYSRHLPQYSAVLMQTPKLFAMAFREHAALKHLINELHPDIVISDNRFGFFNKKAFCVYITHMLRIPFPKPFRFLEFIGISLHRLVINRYNLCLIPDVPGKENLSGRLSHGVFTSVETYFAGILSRFSHEANESCEQQVQKPYICLILSGPEPQRSILLEKVIAAAMTNNMHLIVLSGSPVTVKKWDHELIRIEVNQPTSVLRFYISNSERVVCRAGYSTIMELVSIKKGAIIIPTPGQTEQEYLADNLNGRYGFYAISQNEFSKDSLQLSLPPVNHEYDLTDRTMTDITLLKMLQQYEQRDSH